MTHKIGGAEGPAEIRKIKEPKRKTMAPDSRVASIPISPARRQCCSLGPVALPLSTTLITDSISAESDEIFLSGKKPCGCA